MRIGLLLSRRNKGNKGNLLAHSAKHFLLFLLFLRDDYYFVRIVFFCPTEIKEITEIKVTLTRRSTFCYFCHFCGTIIISCGKNFYCPTVIGFAASLVEEIKEIKEIFLLPRRSHFCYFCYFCGTLLSYAESFLSHGKNGKNGNLYSALREALSAISAISAGLKTCQLVGFVLLSQRNKGNLHPPRRSHFCYFCYFCGTFLSHAKSFFPQK